MMRPSSNLRSAAALLPSTSMRSTWKGGLILTSAAAALLPGLARAQSASYFDRSNNVGVLERPRPDYQALGVQAGGFTIFPSLTLSPEYDDNIFASDKDKTSDEVTVITPAVSARSNWSRNEVDAYARLTSDIYASQSGESTTDYQVGANGRLDVLSRENISGGLNYGHFTESRTAENTVEDASSPVQYQSVGGNLGTFQVLNRLRFSESAGANRFDFQNTTDFAGNFLSQAYRNEYNAFVTGRADYALSPELALSIAESFSNTVYDQKPPTTPLDRDFTSSETTVGADFDVTQLVRGQIQVGYLHDSYTSTAFRPVNGPAVHARVEYFLSGLTTVTGNIDRSVLDSADPTSSSDVQTLGGLRVDHELLRNVILSGQGSYETDQFQGIDRTDHRVSFSASGTYLLNRHLGLTGAYSFLNESSEGAARITPYTVNVISLSLVLQL